MRGEALKTALAHHYPDKKAGSRPVDAGILFRFAHEMKAGDIVVYPSKHDRMVNIGRFTGAFEYVADDPDEYPKGEDHRVERSKWMTNEQGERVSVKTHRRMRPWFFEQDGGWYVQCRYGARVIAVDGTNNAVFVKTLKDVGPVLDAFIAAGQAGELDEAISKAAERKPRVKPGTARAAVNA